MLTDRQIHYTLFFAVCALKFSAFWNFGQSALQKRRGVLVPALLIGSKRSPTEATHDPLSRLALLPRRGQGDYVAAMQTKKRGPLARATVVLAWRVQTSAAAEPTNSY